MTDQVAAPSGEGNEGADGAPNVDATTKPEAGAVDGSLTIGESKDEGALPAEPKGPVVVEFNPTGDAGLDMALGFFGKLGLGPGDSAFDAATAGDFGMLKAKLGQMGDKAKGFEGFIALAEQSYQKSVNESKAKASKDAAAIHEAVGGEEQWKAIKQWASTNATAEEKAQVNATLKQGGVAAKAMAMWLAGKYSNASGVTVEPKSVVKPGGSGKENAVGAGLSAAEYAKEVQAARQKLGYKFEGSKEYQSLQARRLMGQKLGL